MQCSVLWRARGVSSCPPVNVDLFVSCSRILRMGDEKDAGIQCSWESRERKIKRKKRRRKRKGKRMPGSMRVASYYIPIPTVQTVGTGDHQDLVDPPQPSALSPQPSPPHAHARSPSHAHPRPIPCPTPNSPHTCNHVISGTTRSALKTDGPRAQGTTSPAEQSPAQPTALFSLGRRMLHGILEYCILHQIPPSPQFP